MGRDSKIEWTDHTFNPWWGCVKVGLGCQHCYAERYAARYGYDVWGPDKGRRLFGDGHWAQPVKWNVAAEKAGKRQRVFCGSMCDVFEAHYIPEWAAQLDKDRQRLWDLIAETPWLTWMLLTKRPANVLSMAPESWYFDSWPENVWMGASASTEDELRSQWRWLREIPALLLFLSLEPLLEATDVGPCLPLVPTSLWPCLTPQEAIAWLEARSWAGWVIVGGESGPKARAMEPDWAREIRDLCGIAEVPFFMKQMSRRAPIPADLLIREFPDDNRYHTEAERHTDQTSECD